MAGEMEQVSVALKEGRRELVLKGSDIGKSLERHGLDGRIFKLKLLNFLEISDASLPELPGAIGQLEQLKNLILRGNLLMAVPKSIGELSVLRTLDLSRNGISELPESIGELGELYSLDVSSNELDDLPESVSRLGHLTVLDVSNNKLDSLAPILKPELAHLSEVLASQNEVDSLGHEVANLTALKKFDLRENRIQELPADLAACGKLRELLLKGNPLRDARLGKLVKQDKGIKPILESIRTRGVKNATKAVVEQDGEGGKGRKKKGKRGKKAAKEVVEEIITLFIKVLHFKDTAGTPEVRITPAVAEVRPYIVCCLVENIDLQRGNRYKEFIKLQTCLHDGPLCGKRTVATIATHDSRAIQSPLLYDARDPQLIQEYRQTLNIMKQLHRATNNRPELQMNQAHRIQIVPLMKTKPVTAAALTAELMKEADEQRKAQKRNTVSGVHKYLHLLSGHDKYPCLINKDGQVISFPPITNADISKMSKDTTSLFIEVTSSKDLASCKAVMDELIREMLVMELGIPPSTNNEECSSESSDDDDSEETKSQRVTLPEGAKQLTVRQVRILDEEGTMKVVYPSRTDLNYEGIRVLRD